MTSIGRTDAEALATFVRRLRPDWNQAGTVHAISQCRDGALSEIAVALIRLAEDGSVKTPSLLTSPGRHWNRASRDETPAGPNLRHLDMCPDHPNVERTHCTQHEPIATPEAIKAARALITRAVLDAADYHRQMQALGRERAARRKP